MAFVQSSEKDLVLSPESSYCHQSVEQSQDFKTKKCKKWWIVCLFVKTALWFASYCSINAPPASAHGALWTVSEEHIEQTNQKPTNKCSILLQWCHDATLAFTRNGLKSNVVTRKGAGTLNLSTCTAICVRSRPALDGILSHYNATFRGISVLEYDVNHQWNKQINKLRCLKLKVQSLNCNIFWIAKTEWQLSYHPIVSRV